MVVLNERQLATVKCHSNYRFVDGTQTANFVCDSNGKWNTNGPVLCKGM